jgi:Tol biopolymer transport system component
LFSRRRRAAALVVAAALAPAVPAAAAHAANPGSNGRIAFLGPRDDTGADGRGLWVVDANGGNAGSVYSSLYDPQGPRWSPDGTRLAFQVLLGRPASVLTDTLTQRPLTLDDLTPFLDYPTGRFDEWSTAGWAADGTRAVLAHTGGLGERVPAGLYIVGVDASVVPFAPENVTPRLDDAPVWSPDGALIAFSGCAGNRCGLWTATPEGASPRLIGPDRGGFHARNPDWSPDGQQIVYEVGNPRSTGRGIWLVGRDGLGARLVWSSGWEPAFSPDGTRLVHSQGDGLYTMRLNGKGRVRIFAGLNNDPDWEPLPAVAAAR